MARAERVNAGVRARVSEYGVGVLYGRRWQELGWDVRGCIIRDTIHRIA
jgi:hypothetical protein